MTHIPLNMDVRGRVCLVVGGGGVGLRKVQGLLEYGARVRLVSREMAPELTALAETGQVEYAGGDYSPGLLDEAVLVFAATDDSELNRRIADDAVQKGLPVNVADQPERCTFFVPASLRRRGLTVSVSTGGRSPMAAAAIRGMIERKIGDEYGEFVEIMGLVRKKVLAEGRPSRENRELFSRIVGAGLLDRLAEGDYPGAEALILDLFGPGYTFDALGYAPAGKDAR